MLSANMAARIGRGGGRLLSVDMYVRDIKKRFLSVAEGNCFRLRI